MKPETFSGFGENPNPKEHDAQTLTKPKVIPVPSQDDIMSSLDTWQGSGGLTRGFLLLFPSFVSSAPLD